MCLVSYNTLTVLDSGSLVQENWENILKPWKYLKIFILETLKIVLVITDVLSKLICAIIVLSFIDLQLFCSIVYWNIYHDYVVFKCNYQHAWHFNDILILNSVNSYATSLWRSFEMACKYIYLLLEPMLVLLITAFDERYI